MRHLLLVLLLLAAPGWAASQPAIDPTDLTIPSKTFTLDNGLTVVVHEDRSVPIVAVHVWYQVGSRNERRGRTGFAHLFEHFFFNGSENHPHGFREAMDDLGASNRNGTTNSDRTNFFEDVPKSALERTLYLEADRMGFLAGNLSPEMLERERGVVKNEKRQGENRPYGRVWTRMAEQLYPYTHPYSWSPIGSMEDLDAATLDDVREWYQTWYGPNNAILVLAGDIDVAEARALVEKYFGGIPPGAPTTRLSAWVPKLDANIRDRMQDRVPQARVYRIWHVPGAGARAAHALELYADLLAGSDSAPLQRALVYDQKLATDVGAFVWTSQLSGQLMVYASVKPGSDVAATEAALDAVIAASLEKPAGPESLQRARMRTLAPMVRGLERLSARAGLLAESQATLGRADGYLDRLADLQAIDASEIRATAREWLSRHHYTMVVEPFPTLAPKTSDLDRKLLPPLAPPPALAFPEVQRERLANGLDLVLMRRPSVPVLQLALSVGAGIAVDPPEQRGLGQMASDLLLKGTRNQDAYALADARDALGAAIWTEHAQDETVVAMTALKSQLQGSLALYADIVRNPAFPADMIEVQRKQQLAGIDQQRANPNGMAMRAAMPLLFGATHPYAQAGGLGNAESVAAIDRDALAAWHTRWFVPGNATLIVAGDIGMAELKALAQASFGDWQGALAPTRPMPPAEFSGAGRIYLIDKPEAPQSVIFAGHPLAAGARADELALETVMRNFGGMATARLNRNLRLDKHWSYGSWGGVSSARGPRTFSVVAPVQTDRTRDAMVEVRKEIEGLAGARPVAGDELESILRSQIARLPARFESLGALIGAGREIITLNRDPAWYSGYAAAMQALDGDALNGSAAQVVKPDELMWLVVGDLKQIEADVRALGWGEVVVLQP